MKPKKKIRKNTDTDDNKENQIKIDVTKDPDLKYSGGPVNVWCGIMDDELLDPYFIVGNLNGDKYRNFLEQDLSDTPISMTSYVRNYEAVHISMICHSGK